MDRTTITIPSAPIVSLSGQLVLSAPTEADDVAVTILDNDPASTHFRPFVPARVSVEDIRARRIAEAADPTCIILSIHTRPSPGRRPEFVGVAKIYHMDRYYGNSCEFGIIMSAKNFGRGLARDVVHTMFAYVFEKLKFHRLMFRTTPENTVVRSWLDRLGAKFEGIERDGSWDGKGGYKDVCHYSLLEGDWMGGHKARMEKNILGIEKARL
jgi:RimJ/RimL family protein N-acetyltransferase